MAGKTQVASAGELGLYHNRLTHSLKVAQLGRRIAERLRAEYGSSNGTEPEFSYQAPPDPDLIEAACLAHDLGHPPFGHVGEETLNNALDERVTRQLAKDGKRPKVADVRSNSGFEGNAQTFRILAFLSARPPGDAFLGLDLTRATLDAVMKYPWYRPTDRKESKWGGYRLDKAAFEWTRSEAGWVEDAPLCFEAQVMDWCDDVTFAVHDLVDFYRGGFIPLDRLFDFSAEDQEGPFQLESFFESLPRSRNRRVAAMGRDRAWEVWREIQSFGEGFDIWRPTRQQKSALHLITSGLITFFLSAVSWSGRAPCRHLGSFLIDPIGETAEFKQDACELLKELIWHFVIRTPSFASQQVGQARVIEGLLEACRASHTEILPEDRREELNFHGDVLRACVDHVASLTERQAEASYRRLFGFEMGAITDAI